MPIKRQRYHHLFYSINIGSLLSTLGTLMAPHDPDDPAKRGISRLLEKAPSIHVYSVDAVQGHEWDHVLLCAPRSTLTGFNLDSGRAQAATVALRRLTAVVEEETTCNSGCAVGGALI
eukprot:6274659-Amphidinium_carterae.1